MFEIELERGASTEPILAARRIGATRVEGPTQCACLIVRTFGRKVADRLHERRVESVVWKATSDADAERADR
jgi:hypothetical protein